MMTITRPVLRRSLILGLADLALATVPSKKPAIALKRLIFPTLFLNRDAAPVHPESAVSCASEMVSSCGSSELHASSLTSLAHSLIISHPSHVDRRHWYGPIHVWNPSTTSVPFLGHDVPGRFSHCCHRFCSGRLHFLLCRKRVALQRLKTVDVVEFAHNPAAGRTHRPTVRVGLTGVQHHQTTQILGLHSNDRMLGLSLTQFNRSKTIE